MLGQLKVLKSGRHPKTLASIAKHFPLKQWEAMRVQQPVPIPPPLPRLPFTTADDGTSLTQAFI